MLSALREIPAFPAALSIYVLPSPKHFEELPDHIRCNKAAADPGAQ